MKLTCIECGVVWPEDRFNLAVRGQLCYRCHVRGIGVGYTYGRRLFNGADRGGMTSRESAAKILADNKRIEPNVKWSPAPQAQARRAHAKSVSSAVSS